MKIPHDSAPCVLYLLLLAELFVLSSSRPTNRSLCNMFQPMLHQVDTLVHLAPRLYVLTDDELSHFEGVDNKLDRLPHINHTAKDVTSVKVNESLSQLFVDTESFRLHLLWLKTAKDNLSMSSQHAGGASSHLLHLSNLVKLSLQLISVEVPPSPSASLPDVSSAFEALQYSVEISERLQVFGNWYKRVLRFLKTKSSCPRH